MADKNEALAAKLEEIRQMFLQRVHDEWLGRLETLRATLPNDWSPSTLQDAVFLTHTLAGSGATFGFKTLSETARRIETVLRAIVSGDAAATDEAKAEILDGLARLDAESRIVLRDLRT